MWHRKHEKPQRVPATRNFQQCGFCSYNLATGEGERGCHYYECPYLPEALDVRCPTCLYNFYTQEGNPGCGDPPDCDFARLTAPTRVQTLAAWLNERPRPAGHVVDRLTSDPDDRKAPHQLRSVVDPRHMWHESTIETHGRAARSAPVSSAREGVVAACGDDHPTPSLDPGGTSHD